MSKTMLEKLNGSDTEAFEVLAIAGVHLIEGRSLPPEVMEWIGHGLLSLARGEDRNEAFQVRMKKPESNINALRWASVERYRAEGMTKEDAINEVSRRDAQGSDFDAVEASWKKQQKKQKALQKR